MRCAILDDYQDAALSRADWGSLAPAVEVVRFTERFPTREALVAAIGDCAIVVIMRERTPFQAELFERLPNLRLLITSGLRNQSIDLQAAAQHGVTVCGTRGSSAPPVELTWALILGLARHLVEEASALRSGGPWQSTVGMDLNGRTLGLLGLGKIGAKVAEVGLAFGMKVQAWSANLKPQTATALGVTPAPSLAALLQASDVVSVHLVLGERTRSLIGPAQLALMKPTALLINTSRAPIVEEAALMDALRRGVIAGAGVDVFETEPLPQGHPMRTCPNLLATPHLGYVSGDNYDGYFTEAVEDIRAFLDGAPIRRL